MQWKKSEIDKDLEDFDLQTQTECLVLAPINRIYYGPPGTGKTYRMWQDVKTHYEEPLSQVSKGEWLLHSIARLMSGLTWWERAIAALYHLGGSAKLSELVAHPFLKLFTTLHPIEFGSHLSEILERHSISKTSLLSENDRVLPRVFRLTQKGWWHLGGCWRERSGHLLKIVKELTSGQPGDVGVLKRYSFVTFHSSYSYEDFIEGLRPKVSSGIGADSNPVQYEVKPGLFKVLCHSARLMPSKRFALVIDEINRGQVSQIFGELMTLIEPDKRERAQYATSVILPYSGESFSIPQNVDILGTMNSSDRSIGFLDSALRRRFEFVLCLPETDDLPGQALFQMRVKIGNYNINVPKLLSTLNKRLEVLLDRDHVIGHGELTSLANEPDGVARFQALARVFELKILPLLEQFFYDNWEKMRMVLGDPNKPSEAQFIEKIDLNSREEWSGLFGSNEMIESHVPSFFYKRQEKALENPLSYIGIYQKV